MSLSDILFHAACKFRWCKHINKDVMKFQGLYAMLSKLNRSGKTDDDNIDDAMEAFRKAIWNTKNEPFQYLVCWKKLRLHPKWGGGLLDNKDKKRKRENNEGESEGSESDDLHGAELLTSGGRRPEGKKKVKLSKVKKEHHFQIFGETVQPLVENSKAMALSMARKADALEYIAQMNASKLYSEDKGATPEECKKYFALLRKKSYLKLEKGMLHIMFC